MTVRLALVGCGHIGGSLALALRRAGAVGEVVGVDANAAAAARAVELGICDRIAASVADAVSGADVVALAVPVRAMGGLCREVAAAVAGTGTGTGGRLVTDVGSTKAGVVAAGEAALGGRFVGAHPMAGTERAGPDAADAGLFTGRRVILTPTARTEPAAKAQVAALWRAVGAQVIEMDPAHHDRVMAAVSHLPHVAAYALAATVGSVGGDVGRDAVGMAAGGFTDTSRIAATPPAMWIDVFLENREAVLALIDAFDERVAALRAAIVAGDAPAIERLLREAAEGRRRILGQ